MPRIKALVFLACACLMIACNDESDRSPGILMVQPEDLQGTWTLSHETSTMIPEFISNDFAATEWSYELREEPIHLRFLGDSMQVFEYPFEYYGTYKFEVKDDILAVGNNVPSTRPSLHNRETIRLEGDSLFRTNAIQRNWVTSHFFRDTLDADTLALLRRDSVNAAYLKGKWRLDTIISVDYDASYDLELPFEIADSLVFSANDIDNFKGRIISVDVNSTPRPFRFGFVNKHRIWLKPLDWYSEGLPPIEYDREYFISLLGRKGISKEEEVKRMEIGYAADLGALLGNDDAVRTIKATDNPAEISQFLDLILQLPYNGNGKEYKYRRGDLPSWRIRFVDQDDLWQNVLFIGKKIDTPYGTPGEYYVDRKNIELEATLYGLMEAFMSEEE